MAVMPHRRRNLRLPMPEQSERRPRLPVPLLPPSSTPVAFSDLEKLEVIGHGNSGTVYKVLHKPTSTFRALKLIPSGVDPVKRRQVRREMEILRRTDSPFIVAFHGVSEHPSGDISILMEYMEAGTLASFPPLPEPSLAPVARQVLAGLHYLHSRKIVHRDIKPSNLLVTRDMQVKIADFGVGRIMCRTLDTCDSYVGTCAYMSPERFDPGSHGSNYSGYAGDIWSFGLTMLELRVGRLPFLDPGQRPDWATLMYAICFGDPPASPEGASDEFRNFIDCCLQRDSDKRWTAAQLLLHPFVNPDPDSTQGGQTPT